MTIQITTRKRWDSSEAYCGERSIGSVRKDGSKWIAFISQYVPNDEYHRRENIDLGTFGTKTDAVRHLIDESDLDPFWAYYGESWEQHCERIKA